MMFSLVIWKFERLARSLKQLIETVDDLKGRGMGLISLRDAIDTCLRALRDALTYGAIFSTLPEVRKTMKPFGAPVAAK